MRLMLNRFFLNMDHKASQGNVLLDESLDASKKTRKRLREDGKSAAKKKKQGVLDSWVIAKDAAQCKILQDATEIGKKNRLDGTSELQSASQIPTEPILEPEPVLCNIRQRTQEFTWNERAALIYLYLHPNIYPCEDVYDLCSKFKNLNPRTFEGWRRKPDMIRKWPPILKRQKFKKVLKQKTCTQL